MPNIESVTLVPLDEVDWSTMELRYLTCANHPDLRWLTKDPWDRTLHYIPTFKAGEYKRECPCPFRDLRVIIRD